MLKFIAKRLVALVFVLLGLSVITFTITHVVPGDPARLAAGPQARPEQVETLRKELGLDKPLPIQYLYYMRGLVQLDFGKSIRTVRPVRDDIKDFFPATVELALAAALICVVFGVPFGVASAVNKDKPLDHASRVFSLSGVSMPTFWLGLILQLVFYKMLHILPIGGRIDPFLDYPTHVTGMYTVDSLLTGNWAALGSSLQHIFLPALTLAYSSLAVVTRMTRSSMVETIGQDYIRTARAKGLAENAVIYRHALKNAVIPTVTVVGLQFGYLLSGTFLVETIFSWPGMGLYGVQSVMALDIPAIMAVTLLVAVIYVLTNLVVDLMYVWLDPRIEYV
jgi:peptide/nickel transport system permease protein